VQALTCGSTDDDPDGEPFEWVRRLEFAGLNAGVFRRFLGQA